MRSTFCGTPLYLAPEILKGSKYNEKVDIWAIGILCFELYFGTQPFNINEYSELFKIVSVAILRLTVSWCFQKINQFQKNLNYFSEKFSKKTHKLVGVANRSLAASLFALIMNFRLPKSYADELCNYLNFDKHFLYSLI